MSLPRPIAVTEGGLPVTHGGKPHSWSMPPRPKIVCRDVAGRRNPNGGTTWIVLPCVRWPCTAIRLIRVGAILDLAEKETL